MSSAPPIPITCAQRPTIGDRVIPWVNVRLVDGGVDFRRQHRARAGAALINRLCQMCGTGLRRPTVLLGGPRHLERLLFHEAALHPECAHYATRACPMLAGELATFATGPSVSETHRGARCAEPGCECPGWVALPSQSDHGGQPAHPWYAVYVDGYQVATTEDGQISGAICTPAQVLAVRLVSVSGQRPQWTPVPVAEALAGYHSPEKIEGAVGV